MHNYIKLFVFSLVVFSGCKNQSNHPSNNFRQVAEFEPTEAIWMLYPQVTHKNSESITKVMAEMIDELVPYVKIKLVVPNDSLKIQAEQLIQKKYLQDSSVKILKFPYQEFWARDMGPAFLINEKGDKAIADFMFNTWGYNDTTDAVSKIDEKLDEQIANYYHLPIVSTNIVTEGGDHEVNGKGTLLVVEAVEKQRNPDKSIAYITNEFKRVLGVSNVIWLKQGVKDDDNSALGKINGPNNKKYYTVLTTNGHVDEFARFANDSTLLLAWVDAKDRLSEVEKETGRRMEENYKILKDAKDQNGKPFNIIKVPMPYPSLHTLSPGDGVYEILSQLDYKDGHTFPKGKTIDVIAAASYLNFLVANNAVLVAKYWKPGLPEAIKTRDTEALNILKSAFPSKKIIAINALAINLGGGGMHCITINEPKSIPQKNESFN